MSEEKRLERERQTIGSMIELYCRDHHRPASEPLCSDCSELRDYANHRLDKCPFGVSKPTCANCQIHCYKPACREKVREVMRYAGPRMLLRRPILTIRHMLEGRREAPEKPRRESAKSETPGSK